MWRAPNRRRRRRAQRNHAHNHAHVRRKLANSRSARCTDPSFGYNDQMRHLLQLRRAKAPGSVSIYVLSQSSGDACQGLRLLRVRA